MPRFVIGADVTLADSSFCDRLYRTGCIVLTVALVTCACASLTLRYWLKKENEKLDREGGDVGFRYIL